MDSGVIYDGVCAAKIRLEFVKSKYFSRKIKLGEF